MEDRPNTPPPTGDERQTAVLCHVLGFLHFVFPLAGILGPFLLWNAKKDDSAYVDQQGKEAVNFQLTFGLIAALLFVLGAGTVIQFVTTGSYAEGSLGTLMLLGVCGVILGLAEVILVIVAAMSASSGKPFEYPIRIQFLK